MIAVDAMGGDRAPHAIVKGAVAAAQKGVPILLCGKKEVLLSLLPANWKELSLSLEFCEQEIGMAEEPGKAVRSKPQSSLMKAMKAVTTGKASAFFSAGNSGAVLVASVILSGRVHGIYRPAVGAFLPAQQGSFFCIDVGGNVDCKAAYLYQFALMGHLYVSQTKQLHNPRIGLLSNGHEEYKGSREVKKVYELLIHSPLNFVGNIEARDMSLGVVDVVVCDGFVGNVMLKAIQGTAQTLLYWIKQEARSLSWIQKAGLWLSKGLFQRIKNRTDYASVGGALLLGVNHPVILAHGSSDARAIENGIVFAYRAVQEKRIELFNAELKKLLEQHRTFTGAVKQKVRSLFHWRSHDA